MLLKLKNNHIEGTLNSINWEAKGTLPTSDFHWLKVYSFVESHVHIVLSVNFLENRKRVAQKALTVTRVL